MKERNQNSTKEFNAIVLKQNKRKWLTRRVGEGSGGGTARKKEVEESKHKANANERYKSQRIWKFLIFNVFKNK